MINAAMNPNLNFDIMKDFAPIALMTSTPTVLAVIPELGVKSVKELTALAKDKPDTLSFGSSGTGSSTHLALELYKSLAKVKITHVPYTGSPQVVTDMLAGRIHGYFSPASTVAGHVAAGKLVALAVTDATRSAFFPNLPTMVESGVPAGASMPNHSTDTQSGTPASIMVGRSGKNSLRVASVTASATSLPAAMCPDTLEDGEKYPWMRLASMSVTTCGLPE